MSQYQSIVVLTGAGISAESGIKTFRDANGLWENHRLEDVATPEAFQRDPALVHRFYNARRMQLLEGVAPNAAHIALSTFSKHCDASGKQFTLVTQNIDDLHQRAGHQHIYPMHGELLKVRCKQTGILYDCREEVSTIDVCPCCQETNNLRPHVVWFGEMPLYMSEIEHALSQCDLFVSIGTSGNVYPAAGFFQTAKQYGADTVELNLEPSNSGSLFDKQFYGPATEVVPHFFESLLS